ncbi:hypothetical protein IscW_ISCW016238 [Ixodes scapularis]|uniref:Uncharacterized protein n=1 Tax=Ixodes scapularis TaxID=6945 RepID=B7P0Q6_IXOSC|nr:hypothetical protein IscW_ISCW016238 [Ixodes scapularis]|eukprot:XP_002399335.1 hypothetical protein IscW_ISCW016238 [Ixodes scapularis]
MKFNGTAKQYALLPQSQSDDELVRPDDRHNARSPRARTASGQSDGALSLPDLASANGGPDIPRRRPHATMKFNGTAKQYALLPQSQSDDELVRPDDRHNARSPRARTASGQSDGALSLPDLASANGGPDIPRGNSKHVAPCTDHDETTLDPPMSVPRRVCFVLSLCASLLFVVGFGWLIPCRYGSLQPLDSVPIVVQEWNQVFSGLVLTSNLETTFEGDGEKESTVHLGFRRFGDDASSSVGAMAVNGMTGGAVWSTGLYTSVALQKCLGDVCFVLGDGTTTLLAALNRSDGSVLWYAHDHDNRTTLESISDMHVAPDCNDDGLPDIAVAIEARDGRLLGSPLVLDHCTSKPRLLTVLEYGTNDSRQVDVLLYCHTHGGGGSVMKTQLSDLCSGANRSSDAHAHVIWSHINPTALRTATIPDDENPSLILAWGKGHLERLTAPHYDIRWSVDLMLDSPVRSLMSGHFKAYSSYELFVVSDHLHATLTHKFEDPAYAAYLDHFHGVHHYNPKKHKLSLNTQEEQYFIVDFTNKTVNILSRLTVQQVCLSKWVVAANGFQLVSASEGRVQWRMQYDGTTAHVAHLVPAISKYVDGVLIKATTPLESSRADLDAWTHKFEDPAYAAYLDHFHGVHHYNPKVLHRRPGSYYLALATTSANRRSNASVPYDTVLKVVLLGHRKEGRLCCGEGGN